MSRKKIDISNIELKNIDLHLIKDFIDMYDDCQEKFDEYTKICIELRNDKKIKNSNNDNLEKSLNTIINNIINEIASSKDKNKLEILKKEYEKYSSIQEELKKYNNIIKIYNDMYAGNLAHYFNNEKLDMIINQYVNEKYDDYSPEAKEEQKRIERDKYLKKENSTITQIYINIKYLYEICSKIYENNEFKTQKKGLISMIKTKIKKLKLKKSINEIEQEYVKDNEIHLAKIKSKETTFIDLDSLEKNIDFYKMFKEPIFKYVNENNKKINDARIEAEKEKEEIKISENVTVLTRKQQIDSLKQMKRELNEQEEITIPVKTA